MKILKKNENLNGISISSFESNTEPSNSLPVYSISTSIPFYGHSPCPYSNIYFVIPPSSTIFIISLIFYFYFII